MAASEVASKGWHLSEDGISRCCEEGQSRHCDSIIQRALDIDLKEIGDKWLPEDINKGRVDCVEGPAVLQLTKLRVVSAPKDNEESQTAPRLCRVSLTDGHTTCSGVTLEVIKGIGPASLPGSKVLLSGPIEVEGNFLLLTGKNTKFLGGDVKKLTEPWQLKKSLAEQSLARKEVVGEGGPPPFVAFGTKINKKDPISSKKDFKSLVSRDKEEGTAGDDEFQQQRQATIQQALQAKTSGQGGKAAFGGGNKQLVKDADVARIVEIGFSAPEATKALKSCGGNMKEAVNSLMSGGPQRGGYNGRYSDRGRPGPRGGNYEGRGGKRRQGRGQGDEEDDDDDYVINSRPSGQPTLFDFLDAKLHISKEDSKKGAKTSVASKQTGPASSNMTSTTTVTTSTVNVSHNTSKPSTIGAQEPVFKHSNRTQARPNTSHGFSTSSDLSTTNHTRPSSHYSNKDGSNSGSYHGNRGNDSNHSVYKGYSDSSQSGAEDKSADRRQHTVLPPRFAKQRIEAGKGEGGGGESESRLKEPPSSYQGRQPLFENNHPNTTQHGGRHGRSTPIAPNLQDRHSYRDSGQSGQRSGSHYNSRVDDERHQKPSFHSGQNKDFGSTNHSRDQSKKDSPSAISSSYQSSSSSQPPVPSSQPPQYHKHSNQQNHPRNSSRQGMNENHYNPNSSANPYHNYRQQQQDYSQQYQQSQQQDNRGQQFNPKSRMDKRGVIGKNAGPPMTRGGGGGGPLYREGDMCMAKYWEDRKFYPAIVEAVEPRGMTVVVQFLDYGNQEEVYVSDVRPMHGQMGDRWGYPPHQPPPSMCGMPGDSEFEAMGFGDGGHFVPAMQFSRGQGGHMNGNNRRKQTQPYYTPPNLRH